MAFTRSTLQVLLPAPSTGDPNFGKTLWTYDSVDTVATIYAIGYMTNVAQLGMKKGDLVLVTRWTTTVPAAYSERSSAAGVANIIVGVTLHVVMGLSTVGDADLSDGLAITITNT